MPIHKRSIPFDSTIKITLLTSHFIGFGFWLGNISSHANSAKTFLLITSVSGALLVLRELIKDGWMWLMTLEGAVTILKVVLLSAAIKSGWDGVYLMSGIVLLGVLSAHLPTEIKERVLWRSLRL